MKTIALRFGEHFSPRCGTIAAHQELIDEIGYVWYGKMGSAVSKKVIDKLFNDRNIKILLINSGKTARYWAYISKVQREVPPLDEIPYYYRDAANKIKTWFQITKFESAPRDILSKCRVVSSGNILGTVSKHSMCPYFIIEIMEMNNSIQ